jgi:dimethylhistidine N-methyltransferase
MMSGRYKRIDPVDLKDQRSPRQMFALDVLFGLSASPKRLSSKYLYDTTGSELFRKITTLPEYYPTGCEREILERHADDLAALVGVRHLNLVELGSGDGHKTEIVLKSFLGARLDFRYVPIDISESAIRGLVQTLSERFPGLEVQGLVSEYFTGVQWLGQVKDRMNLVLFSGSNIGNFSRSESHVFLRSLWNSLNDGDQVLIGFDLKKDIDKMLHAYNDSQGVTRDFNLNLLRRINHELGGDFDVGKFRFFSTYDVFEGAIKSYLVSLVRQDVFIEAIGQAFSFEPWEPIQTEYSYKYLQSDIDLLAQHTGFEITHEFYDSNRYFTNSLWRVRKLSKNSK